MRGTINGSRPYLNSYFFIHGEDGNEYCASFRSLQRKKNQCFCWDGNGVTFDVSPEQEDGRKPKAINVVPDHVKDPNEKLKTARRNEAKRNLAINQEKARINAIRQEDMERLREFKRKSLWYVVEWRDGDKWVALYTSEGLCRFREVADAKAYAKMMGNASPKTRFRFVKRYICESIPTTEVAAL